MRNPIQPQSSPERKAPQAINPVTSGSPVANKSVATPPATGGSPNKTSASRLKEFCDKWRCGDPEYKVRVPEEQRFQYTVTVKTPQPVIAVGVVCSSKKDAKQSAAQEALRKLRV